MALQPASKLTSSNPEKHGMNEASLISLPGFTEQASLITNLLISRTKRGHVMLQMHGAPKRSNNVSTSHLSEYLRLSFDQLDLNNCQP